MEALISRAPVSLLCTELHVKVHQKVQQLTQWKENITFIWHLSEHLISLSPHRERRLFLTFGNIWETLCWAVTEDVIKIVFSDQSLVKTNNQYRLNMHQTQSFLENQTNIPRILLGSFTRKTWEEKLFCLSSQVCLVYWIFNRLGVNRVFPESLFAHFMIAQQNRSDNGPEVESKLRQAEQEARQRLVITFKFSCNFAPSCVHLNSEHWSHLRRQRERYWTSTGKSNDFWIPQIEEELLDVSFISHTLSRTVSRYRCLSSTR